MIRLTHVLQEAVATVKNKVLALEAHIVAGVHHLNDLQKEEAKKLLAEIEAEFAVAKAKVEHLLGLDEWTPEAHAAFQEKFPAPAPPAPPAGHDVVKAETVNQAAPPVAAPVITAPSLPVPAAAIPPDATVTAGSPPVVVSDGTGGTGGIADSTSVPAADPNQVLEG